MLIKRAPTKITEEEAVFQSTQISDEGLFYDFSKENENIVVIHKHGKSEKQKEQKKSGKSKEKNDWFRQVKYLFGTIISIILVAAFSFISITYKSSGTTPKQQIADIAGQSIVQTAKLVNPSTDEKRYYSVLIMGIDTRGVKFNGDEYTKLHSGGTRKMDVIMQVIYDREKNKLIYISIPRDTSLPVTEACMHQEREDQKYINRFYDMAEKNKCPFSGADAMKKYVSYITGYPIDHYVIVTLDTFVQLIDVVGLEHNGKKGIYIDVPRNISDYCPNKANGYDHVYFPKGRQFLNSKQALCYIRVRKTSNDFDRNKRQQQLITEVGKLITSNSTLNNPVKLYEIYNKFSKEMQMSSVSLQDITMGIEIMDQINLDSAQKIVLDYEFGGTNALLTKPLYSKPGTHTRSGYYLIPTAWEQDCCRQDEWKLVREYLHAVIEDPSAVPQQAAVYAYVNKYTSGKKAVFNNATYQGFKQTASSNFIYYNESKYSLSMISGGPDIQIFDFSKGRKRAIADKIAELSGGKVYDGSQAPFKKPLNNEEIAIVVRVK